METVYELIRNHSSGKGEAMMWKSTEMISDAIQKHMPEEDRRQLIYDLYGLMSGGHYDCDMAHADVQKMYYVDEAGKERHGPFISDDESKTMYRSVSSKIPKYNEWDWFVTVNMIASDNRDLIRKWFPNLSTEETVSRYSDMAVNWLDDKDWPTTDRIWSYLH